MKKNISCCQKLTFFWQKNFFLICFFIFFLLRLPSLFEPFTYGDEGVYLTLGQATQKGALLYRDIHDNKPPLIYLFAAAAYHFSSYRLLSLIWSLVGFFFFYLLTKEIFPKKIASQSLSLLAFSFLAALHFLEGNVANAENFFIYLSIAGFWLILKYPQPLFIFIAGLLFSFSSLFKIPAITDFITAVVIFFILKNNFRQIFSRKNLQHLFLFFTGFLLPHLVFLTYFYLNHALSFYLKAAFAQNVPYLSSWVPDQPRPLTLPLGLIFRTSFVALLTLVLFFLQKIKKLSLATCLILLWFAFSLFAALLSSRPYPHYLFQAVPALSLSLGLIFASPKILALIPFVFALTINFIFNKYQYYHYPNLPYYQKFLSFVIGKKTQTAYFQSFDQQANNLYQAARFLKSHTEPDEKIFIWGDQPCLYALSERQPVGRFTVAYHIDNQALQTETIYALQNESPRFITIVTNQVSPFPQLAKFIEAKYLPLASFGPFQIYYRRNLNIEKALSKHRLSI